MSTAVAPTPTADRFALRLFGVGAVVFLANTGLLVLQLVAGKLLSPFIGSALGTWTAVIAAFLTGIALGNFLGGRMSERRPSAAKLAGVLLAGVLATLWMAALPIVLNATNAHAVIGIDSGRTPLLAFLLCLPVATVLSLLTPLAIRFGVPDVTRTGSVAGTIFAVSSLGCLLGNYLTGFVLIPELTINLIVYSVAGLLAVTGVGALLVGGMADGGGEVEQPSSTAGSSPHARPALSLPVGFAVVFLCSFAGMSLELAGFRLMATLCGVSLFTLTGVIGVMLAGTCLGNWVGGKLADRAHRGGTTTTPQFVLAASLLAAAVCSVIVLVAYTAVNSGGTFASYGPIGQVVALTLVQFFLPMALLGTISPQVIRLCVSDVGTAGRTAGRVYAVSTSGAIAGTLLTGFLLISALGMKGTVLLAAVLPCAATALLVRVWKEPAMLYVMSAVGGSFLGGTVLLFRGSDELTAESNYYSIHVDEYLNREPVEYPDVLAAAAGPRPPAFLLSTRRRLSLDRLLHSEVNMDDPTFFHYKHEQVQLEAVYAAADRQPASQRVLVIGGGGYTFPRGTRTLLPTAAVDVVEIDPGVTKVAYRYLGLDPALGIRSIHRDGRQFVAEQAEPNSYDVVTLDAVNDYSVPGHLLTKECNDAVKRTLTKDGVYLVTVIDLVRDGKLWKAAFHTLKQSFAHVHLLLPTGQVASEDALRRMDRAVVVLYASDAKLDLAELNRVTMKRTGKPAETYVVSDALTAELLDREKELVLTDQYAPVDNLMAIVFRRSERQKPASE